MSHLKKDYLALTKQMLALQSRNSQAIQTKVKQAELVKLPEGERPPEQVDLKTTEEQLNDVVGMRKLAFQNMLKLFNNDSTEANKLLNHFIGTNEQDIFKVFNQFFPKMYKHVKDNFAFPTADQMFRYFAQVVNAPQLTNPRITEGSEPASFETIDTVINNPAKPLEILYEEKGLTSGLSDEEEEALQLLAVSPSLLKNPKIAEVFKANSGKRDIDTLFAEFEGFMFYVINNYDATSDEDMLKYAKTLTNLLPPNTKNGRSKSALYKHTINWTK